MYQANRTLIGVVAVVKRPYKARIEIRKTSDGYSVTIVLPNNAEKHLSKIADRLGRLGYMYSVDRDQYGYVRIHMPRLKYYDVMFIRKLVEDAVSSPPRGEEELAVCAS